MLATNSRLTPNFYVDKLVNESSLVRSNQEKDLINFNLTITNSITLNTQAVNNTHVIPKTYVHQFHNDNERNRRGLTINFYIESVWFCEKNPNNNFNRSN